MPRCASAVAAKAFAASSRRLREPINPATGTPFVDDKNPNPALRRRPIIGLPMFSDMRPAGPNNGPAISTTPTTASTYDSDISIAGPDTLRVDGCVGALCGGENWTRAKTLIADRADSGQPSVAFSAVAAEA